jgi:hypothetical protein
MQHCLSLMEVLITSVLSCFLELGLCYQLFAQCRCSSVADNLEAGRRKQYEIKNTDFEILSNESVYGFPDLATYQSILLSIHTH